MSVFISYSHEDKKFVEKLAAALIRKRTNVWLDKFELRPGDSLIQRIQDAIQRASALLVVLSKTSVQSEWCKRELSAGLIRELEEKRVVVIPVLIEDCDIPLFLRDKYYADFRENFQNGLNDVMEGIAAVTSDSLGRIHSGDSWMDWSMDWFFENDRFVVRFTIIEHAKTAPYTVLTVIRLVANAEATRRYKRFADAGFGWFGRHVIVEMLSDLGNRDDLFIRLEDATERSTTFGFGDSKSDAKYEGQVTSRRVGEDTGKDILVNFGGQLQTLRAAVMASRGKMSEEETLRLAVLLTGRAG